MPLDENTPLLLQSCRQMRPHMSALADGTLRGFWRWYALLHVAQCAQCTAVYHALTELRERLAALGTIRVKTGLTETTLKTAPLLQTDALLRHAEERWRQAKDQGHAHTDDSH